MATTYDKIATTTLGSAAASITFSSIAASWTDLRLVFVGTTTTATTLTYRFNNDSSSAYSFTYLSGNGTNAQSGSFTNQTEIYGVAGLATIPIFESLDIFSYAGSTYKTALYNQSYDKNGSGYQSNLVALWRNTSAITRIDIIAQYGSTNTFSAGTTATLYGIKAA